MKSAGQSYPFFFLFCTSSLPLNFDSLFLFCILGHYLFDNISHTIFFLLATLLFFQSKSSLHRVALLLRFRHHSLLDAVDDGIVQSAGNYIRPLFAIIRSIARARGGTWVPDDLTRCTALKISNERKAFASIKRERGAKEKRVWDQMYSPVGRS